ncbi:MAG: hypothetical protein ACMV1D_01245, partial [Macromonas sp.]
ALAPSARWRLVTRLLVLTMLCKDGKNDAGKNFAQPLLLKKRQHTQAKATPSTRAGNASL